MSQQKHTPTDSELSILNVLWNQGPSTVHEVRDKLPENQSDGYTTVLKLLQIMHKKELVTREKDGRAHRYEAAIKKSDVQQDLLDRLLNRAFDGSMQQLIQQAISSRKLNKSDLDEINQLMDQINRENNS